MRTESRRVYTRLFYVWVTVTVAGGLAIKFYPPPWVSPFGLVDHALIFGEGLLSFEIFRSTDVAKHKFLFLNFFLFGCVAQPLEFLSYFIPRIFENPFAGLYGIQYLSSGVFLFSQVFCIWFCCLQLMLKNVTVLSIYFVTVCVTGTIFIFLFYPFLENPRYLYTKSDITDFRIVDRAVNLLRSQKMSSPSAEDVAVTVALSRWDGDHRLGDLTESEKVDRIREILPYLEGENYETILNRPLMEYDSYMNISCVLILITFLVYQFVYDPPQPAYVEKMQIALVAYSALQVLHFHVFSRAVELDRYLENYNDGAILFAIVQVNLALFLGLRLKFMLSAEGQFYERKLSARPRDTTRWRDLVDNIIILHFFKRREILRRLATTIPQAKDKAESVSENSRKETEKTLDKR